MLSYLSFVINYLAQQPSVTPLCITHYDTAQLLERLSIMGPHAQHFRQVNLHLVVRVKPEFELRPKPCPTYPALAQLEKVLLDGVNRLSTRSTAETLLTGTPPVLAFV